jgi:hypothetical protein
MSFDKEMFKSNPNFKFKEVIRDLAECLGNSCQVETYKDKNEDTILVYAHFDIVHPLEDTHDLTFINLATNQEIKKIPQKDRVMCIRYFQNSIDKKRYLTSTDRKQHLNVYDLDDDYKCILEVETKFELFIYSTVLIFEGPKKWVVCSSIGSNNITRVYDIDTKEPKDLSSTKELTVFYLDYWYNQKGEENEKHNIIQCCKNKLVITSYPADKNYFTNEFGEEEPYIQVGGYFEKNGQPHFICSSTYGLVRAFNLETKQQVAEFKYEHGKVHLYGGPIVWWNEHYLLLNDFQQRRFITFCIDDDFKVHGKILCPELENNKKIKKVKHPKYGECLITCGTDWKVKLFTNRDIEAKEFD